MTPCACCGSEEIKGPYLGDMTGGKQKVRLYQCWGDLDGRRCENTRALKVEEITPEKIAEGAG